MRNHHLNLAKFYWKSILQKGDQVIDATCGNGYDTLFLSQLVLTKNSGKVFAYDIQEKAIKNTKNLLQKNFCDHYVKKIVFFHKTHENFSEISNDSVKLIVYNLGYLPGGDKSLHTQTESTLKSVKKALALTTKAVSIMCYPGHNEGKCEMQEIISFLSTLKQGWHVFMHQKINHPLSPCLLWIEKN